MICATGRLKYENTGNWNVQVPGTTIRDEDCTVPSQIENVRELENIGIEFCSS
jgi:hypothetical protein